MNAAFKGSMARLALALARRSPVRWLRAANQYLHTTACGRRLLDVIWNNIADEPTVIPRGPLAGWRFAAGGGQPGYVLGASEPDLQDALLNCIRPGDVFYDIGANVGFFTLLAARAATPSGRVYAFEPVDANVRALKRNLEINDVGHAEVVQSAVGSFVGTVHMSLGGNLATAHVAENGVLTVTSTTVDAFVAAGNRPPSVMKIDVEGAEDEVLSGMRHTIHAHRPVIFCELHYDHDDPRRGVITKLLHDADYDELPLPLDGGSMPHLLAVPHEAEQSYEWSASEPRARRLCPNPTSASS